MRARLWIAVLLMGVPGLAAQEVAEVAAESTLTLHFERVGLPVPAYTFTLHPDGSGTYTATYAPTPAQSSRYGGAEADATEPQKPPTEATVPFTLSQATAAKLFERARSTHFFHVACEAKAKNIAYTGAKTYSYAGPDGAGKCTYNYTENKTIEALTETFMAIAYTLDEGRTLAFKHRYDHLGLDPEMAQLTEAARSGHAIEMGTIAPILRSITEDTQLLERVRDRAAGLLAMSTAVASR